MKALISLIEIVLGIWLVASPWFLGYGLLENQIADVVLGAALIVLGAVYFSKNKAAKPIDETNPQLFTVISVLGIVIVAEGIIGAVALGYTVPAIVNEVIVGILAFALAMVASMLASPKKVVLSDENGGELVTLTKIDFKDEGLSVRAKAFGTMPMLMKVTPEQLWSLVGYLSFDVISHVPGMLVSGRAAAKETAAKEAAKQAEKERVARERAAKAATRS